MLEHIQMNANCIASRSYRAKSQPSSTESWLSPTQLTSKNPPKCQDCATSTTPGSRSEVEKGPGWELCEGYLDPQVLSSSLRKQLLAVIFAERQTDDLWFGGSLEAQRSLKLGAYVRLLNTKIYCPQPHSHTSSQKSANYSPLKGSYKDKYPAQHWNRHRSTPPHITVNCGYWGQSRDPTSFQWEGPNKRRFRLA